MKLMKFAFGVAVLLILAHVAVEEVNATSTLQVSLTVSSGGICNGIEGFATGQATASGGTAPYTFSWAGDATGSQISPNSSLGFVNAPAGSRPALCVTVTSADGQSVTVSKSVTITCSPGEGF